MMPSACCLLCVYCMMSVACYCPLHVLCLPYMLYVLCCVMSMVHKLWYGVTCILDVVCGMVCVV